MWKKGAALLPPYHKACDFSRGLFTHIHPRMVRTQDRIAKPLLRHAPCALVHRQLSGRRSGRPVEERSIRLERKIPGIVLAFVPQSVTRHQALEFVSGNGRIALALDIGKRLVSRHPPHLVEPVGRTFGRPDGKRSRRLTGGEQKKSKITRKQDRRSRTYT